MIFNLIVIVVFALVISVFAISNSMAVSVSFFFWQVPQISLSLVILISFLLGVIFAGAIGLYNQIRDRIKILQLTGRLKDLEKDNLQLR